MMALSITPKLIIEAAKKRQWDVAIISERYAIYKLSLPDGRHFYVRNITSIKTAMVNSLISNHKEVFQDIAEAMAIPMPQTLQFNGNNKTANDFLDLHKRVVVKPTDQSHGHGVTVDIENKADLEAGIALAQTCSKNILIQQQVYGDDYRLLFIDNKLAAAAIREPAFIIGDGKNTIHDLIVAENASANRSDGYQNTLTTINEKAAAAYLKDRATLIPAMGEKVQVIGTANIGQGGVAIDVTDTIEPRLVAIGQAIVDHFDMGLCGVDIMYKSDGEPYVIEINAGPSLGLHEAPYRGVPRQTPDAFLDWLAK